MLFRSEHLTNMEVGFGRHGPNVSTTPLQQWGFQQQQCLPFSWTILRGKHCRNPIAAMRVADMFGHGLLTPNMWGVFFKFFATLAYCSGKMFYNFGIVGSAHNIFVTVPLLFLILK